MKSTIIYLYCLAAWSVGTAPTGGSQNSGIGPWIGGAIPVHVPPASKTFQCSKGRIHLRSNAPLEIIEARSTRLRGVVDPGNQNFAWTVDVNSFEGFNSPLQREHFNENYMETSKYPNATFTGKIIEKINFEQDGSYPVRAKGKLTIHGVEQERIIKGTLEIKGRKIRIEAMFSVPLTDHNITIPKIVHQKIAEEIVVNVEADLAFVD